MTVLFVVSDGGYIRTFESVLRMLCERGHGVHVAFHRPAASGQFEPGDIAQQLSREYPAFSCGDLPVRADGWGVLSCELRLGLDSLRHPAPEAVATPSRGGSQRPDAPPWLRQRTRRGLFRTAFGRRLLAVWFRAIERAIRSDPEIDAFVRRTGADVLAVTPTEAGSSAAECVRSARALGVPIAFCVATDTDAAGQVLERHGVRANRTLAAAASTPTLVDALEALAALPARRPERTPIWAPLVRRRFRPRAEDLRRRAQEALDANVAREAAAQARQARAQARDSERRARAAEKARKEEELRAQRAERERVTRGQSLERLVADFCALGEVERRAFLRAALHRIPADSFIELHAAAPPRKLDYDHADIYLRVTTKGEALRLGACAKEPFTIDWLHGRVGAGDVLYDIGANVGAYSLVAAKKPGGGARVFSFEPNYATVASLCANILLNDVAGQVTPLPIALSSGTGASVLSLQSIEPGTARHLLGYGVEDDATAVYQQPVITFRLDDAIEMFRLPLPNHIKLDVDGGEFGVLEGAARTLASPTLRSILIEVSTPLSVAVTERLEQHGLRLDAKISIKNRSGEYAIWYGLFTRHAATRALQSTVGRTESVST